MLARILIVLLMLVFSVQAEAQILFYDNCEDAPNLTQDWNPSGVWISGDKSEITASTDYARAGSRSYKFYLPPLTTGSSSDKRTELRLHAYTSPEPLANMEIGKEYWIGYSILYPPDFQWPDSSDSEWVITGQWHNAPDSTTCDSMVQGPTCSSHLTENTPGKFKVFITGDDRECTDSKPFDRFSYTDDIDVLQGTWNDVVINVKWGYSLAQNPHFKMWVNGVLKVDDSGINCWNDNDGPFWKMGIYAWNTDAHLNVYYDEIRVGDANSSYAEVAPGGGTATNPLTITTSTLGTWTQGSTSSGTLAATGGDGAYTWTKVTGPTELTVTAATGAWSVTPAGYGSYSAQIRCTDGGDNTTTKTFTGTITQTITPTPPSVTAFDLPASSATLEIPVTAFTGSATTTAYIILESPGTPLANDSRWSVTAPTSVTAANVGNRTFYAYVKDADGQVSAPAIDGTEVVIISIDTEIVTGWTETATDDVWSAACSITPKTVYFDSALGIEVTALVDVTSPHVWYYSTGTLYTYNTTDPDTAYTTITASTDVTPDPVTPAEGVITTGGNKTIITTGEKVLRIR